MIVKLIQCAVYKGKVGQFSEGQKAWEVLRTAPGFRTQIGGWKEDEPNKAIILGFWDSLAAYQNFMTEIHDDIFADNNQIGTYDPKCSSVTLWTNEAIPRNEIKIEDKAGTEVSTEDRFIIQLLKAKLFSYHIINHTIENDAKRESFTQLSFHPFNQNLNPGSRLFISTDLIESATTIPIEPTWQVILGL